MLARSAVVGWAGGNHVARLASSKRQLAVLACAAGVALTLALASGRSSLPSFIEHGWQSLIPGRAHQQAPQPEQAPTSAPAVGRDAVTSLAAPAGSRPAGGANHPASQAGTAVGKRTRPTVSTSGHSSPAPRAEPTPPTSPTPASPPSPAPAPPAPGPTPPSPGGTTSGATSDGSVSSTPSVSANVDDGPVGITVDTGGGNSVSVSVPVPSDPTEPSAPTVTTPSATTPGVTIPVPTGSSSLVPGL